MAGFSNDVIYGTNVDFSGSNPGTGIITQNGQLLVGSNVAPFIRAYVPTGTNNIGITTGNGTIDFALTGQVSISNGGTGAATVSTAQNNLQIGPYSTGTYLPIAKGSTGDPTVTYANQAGAWTKIGNLVFVSMFINWAGGGYVGGAGNAQFSLPFPAINVTDILQTINGANGSGQFAPYFLAISPGSSVGTVSNGGGFVSVGVQAGIGSNNFTGCYLTG